MINYKHQYRRLLFVGDDTQQLPPPPSKTVIKHIETINAVDQVVMPLLSNLDAIICIAQQFNNIFEHQWIREANKRSIPVGLIWHDAIGNEETIHAINPLSLNIILDDQNFVTEYEDRVLRIWTPIYRAFVSPDSNRPIDVCFLGKTDCLDRESGLYHILNSGIPIFTAGNQPWNTLKEDVMFHYLTLSKIVINFSNNRYIKKSSLKGRVIESMVCGAMVIEDENDSTNKYFTPGSDLIWFHNHDDLVNQIRFYLANESLRKTIAANGQYTCITQCNNERWWNLVLTKLTNLKPLII